VLRLVETHGGLRLSQLQIRDGWIIGGPEVRDGIQVAETQNLWVTHDRGLHWHVVPIPLPRDPASAEPYLIGLKFANSHQGVVVARQQLSGRLFRFLTLVTSDGGGSWRISQFEGYHASPSIVGRGVIWSVSDWPVSKASLRFDDNTLTLTPPRGAWPQASLGDVDFVNESNGWAPFFDGRAELAATTDGGRTFRIITPPVAAQCPIRPPEVTGLNGMALRAPAWFPGPVLPPPSARRGPLLGSPGGPMQVRGRGFLRENTVWIGSRSVDAASEDGQTLLFMVPQDLPPGEYDVAVENANGKSNSIEAKIGPQQPLHISWLQSRDPRYSGNSTFHPGQQVALGGTGFLTENTVWFGTHPVKTDLMISMGAGLFFQVPDTLAPGTYEVYVTNANGKSNVISAVIE
jgi:hypothetical protein